MLPSHFGSLGSSRQRGAISILTAFLLIVLLALLALVVDTGRLYLEKRSLQKTVDMAALDVMARLPEGHCAGGSINGRDFVKEFATESAINHGFVADDDGNTLTVNCATIGIDSSGLRSVTPNSNGSAVQITASKSVPASLVIRGGTLFSNTFSGDTTLSATSSAQRSQRNDPVAAFSVSSRLLSLDNDKIVGQLLKTVGLNAQDLEILGPGGVLSSTSIRPSGLLKALGIEVSIDELGVLTPDSVVSTSNLSVAEIIEVSAKLISDNAIAAQVEALSTKLIESSLETVDLFGENGLIRLASGSQEGTRAALETEVNLGELLGLSLIAGSGEKSLELSGLDLLGIHIAVGITEPPALAIGPVGTKAHTGQARLHIDIDTNQIVGVGLLTQLLGTRIHLPLTIDLARAEATLTDISCAAEPPTVDIDVSSSLLETCIGQTPAPSDGEPLWLGSESCSSPNQTSEMTLIKILGAPLVHGKLIIRGSEDAIDDASLTGIAVGQERSYTPSTPVPLGNIVTNIIGSVIGLLDSNASNSKNESLTEDIASEYLKASSSGGRYDPKKAAELILNGNLTEDGEGLPSIADNDWTISSYKCNLSVLGICLLGGINGRFSDAFADMSDGSFILQRPLNNYQACKFSNGNDAYNTCILENLTLILQRKPGGLDINISDKEDDTEASIPDGCQTFVCKLLEAPLNSISSVLTDLLTGGLGLELGRADVKVESISCGVPTLVQ